MAVMHSDAMAAVGLVGAVADVGASESQSCFDGPYRVVLERLQRLVRYRDQQIARLSVDDGDQRAAAELVRVRHMIRDVHRAVSMNATARAAAARIDPDGPALGSQQTVVS
jgi:hypothetical protein